MSSEGAPRAKEIVSAIRPGTLTDLEHEPALAGLDERERGSNPSAELLDQRDGPLEDGVDRRAPARVRAQVDRPDALDLGERPPERAQAVEADGGVDRDVAG